MEPETKSNNSGIIIVLVGLAALLVIFGMYMANKTPKQDTPNFPARTTETSESTISSEKNSTKQFTVTASNFSYDVTEIKVRQGDKVRIKLINKEGFHDWQLTEFGAKTKVIKTDEEDMVEFVADKTGTFEYFCSVGQHRAMGMKGNLIVE